MNTDKQITFSSQSSNRKDVEDIKTQGKRTRSPLPGFGNVRICKKKGTP